MYYNLKVEPVLFQQLPITSTTGRFSYTIYTYWVQLEPYTDIPSYSNVIPIDRFKDLGDNCYLIETTEEVTQCDIIIL